MTWRKLALLAAPANVVIFVIVSLACTCPVWACSCSGPTPVCSVYWQTDVLFLGHVTRVEHVRPSHLVYFDVTTSYRGHPGEQAIIHTADQGSACGYEFQQGHDYLVYAYSAPNGDLAASHCTRTHEVANRADDEDIQWIEGLAKAPPGASVFGQIQSHRPNELGGYEADSLADIALSITGPESKTVTSGPDGRFRAIGLAPGKYTVSAVAPARYAPFPSSTVTVQDRGCAEVDLSTRLDGHIRGHVYLSDGAPAAGIYLTAKIADSEPHEPWTWQAKYATSAADGSFDFAGLSPGSYVFAANMDFAPVTSEGPAYYRRAFFPGSTHRTDAAVIVVDAGGMVDNLRFFLPPDSPLPAIPLEVTVLGFDGQRVPRAQILAYDDMWENSVTPAMASTDENGKANVSVRSGSHYDIEAIITQPDSSQACAEPVGVDVGRAAAIVLVLSHHTGNCKQYKKPRN